MFWYKFWYTLLILLWQTEVTLKVVLVSANLLLEVGIVKQERECASTVA
jgi:hypothetical protein